MASLSFSADSVSAALNKLKHGKSEGGSLTSDHLIFAPHCFAEVLAPVFSCLVQHGYMLPVFRDAVILPVPKGGNLDLSLSASYRGIALASCFSKVLEYCILEAVCSPLVFNLVSNQSCLPHCALVC